MAANDYTELCCRSGGSNLNAGSTYGGTAVESASPSFEYASGNWDSGTLVFTVVSGNPSSDGVAVGMFASIYPDGSTTTPYIARVTAVSTTTITVTNSFRIGTAPSTGTGNRTLRIGGAWAGPNGTDGFPWNAAGAFSLRNLAGYPVRFNMMNTATFNVTAGVTSSTVINNTTIEGFTTTYGDGGIAGLDGGTSGASYQLWTPVVNGLLVRNMTFCNNGATGSAHGVSSSVNAIFERCAFHNFRGIGLFGACRAVACESYSCNKSATFGWAGFYSPECSLCISHNHGTNTAGFFGIDFVDCIAAENAGSGFVLSNSGKVSGCIAYANGQHGVTLTAGNVAMVRNSILYGNTLWGINVQNIQVAIANCAFGANGSGTINPGTTGAARSVDEITLTSDPFIDATNGDFRSTSSEIAAAAANTFFQTTSYTGSTGYRDAGPLQRLATGSGAILYTGGL